MVFSKNKGGESVIFENIQALCKERGVNVAQLEKACGLGNATVRGWATADPQVSKLKRVADFFGCTVDDLLKK